jgi:hypothetical protein
MQMAVATMGSAGATTLRGESSFHIHLDYTSHPASTRHLAEQQTVSTPIHELKIYIAPVLPSLVVEETAAKARPVAEKQLGSYNSSKRSLALALASSSLLSSAAT